MNEPNAARILQSIFEMMVLKQCNIYKQPTSNRIGPQIFLDPNFFGPNFFWAKNSF